MNRLLVIGPLVVVWLVALLILMGTAEAPSVPLAQASPYLTLDRCRTALRGADGSDNDVLFELRRLNARRWGWGAALRVDYRTVVQVIRLRRRSGAWVLVYYACQWRGGAVADWRFVPYR
jgi:hypothetical protein